MPVHPATILVVDDEEGVRMVISRTLQGAGFAVLEAEHGEAALVAVQGFNGPLVLAVVDENMPVMTGSEFVREFRPIRPHVPVLFVTGGADRRAPAEDSRRIAAPLHEARVVVLPGLEHDELCDGSPRYVEELEAFLDRVAPPPRE